MLSVVDTNIGNYRKMSFCLVLIEKFTKQIIVADTADTASNFRTVMTQVSAAYASKHVYKLERVKREQPPFLKKMFTDMHHLIMVNTCAQ